MPFVSSSTEASWRRAAPGGERPWALRRCPDFRVACSNRPLKVPSTHMAPHAIPGLLDERRFRPRVELAACSAAQLFELFQGPRPIFVQQARERAVGEEFAA